MQQSRSKYALPLSLLALVVIAVVLIRWMSPEASRRAKSMAPQIQVEVENLQPKAFDVEIASYGRVQPRTQSQLVAQVGGQIIYISPDFRAGGFFEKDEVLLKIDPRDYEAEVKIASATLMEARQALAEEEAQSLQAQQNWQRLGNKEKAPDLVLRKPQLAAAMARVASAEAALDKAKLSLERTQIHAPYAGRILTQDVDLGQVINSNTRLAQVYAIDYVEVRLPIKNEELALIDLPESYRFGAQKTQAHPSVELISTLGEQQSWHGKLVRTEGAIDDVSRQLFVIAQIDDPYGLKAQNKQPLKIGQYVTARIQGKRLDNALVVPNRTLYQGSYVYLEDEGLLKRREVNVFWQNESHAVIAKGLNAGDHLVLSPLGQVNSGTPVSIAGQEIAREKPKGEITSFEQLPEKAKQRIINRAKREGKTPEQVFSERQLEKKAKGAKS